MVNILCHAPASPVVDEEAMETFRQIAGFSQVAHAEAPIRFCMIASH
jgi:hypothetical protein